LPQQLDLNETASQKSNEDLKRATLFGLKVPMSPFRRNSDEVTTGVRKSRDNSPKRMETTRIQMPKGSKKSFLSAKICEGPFVSAPSSRPMSRRASAANFSSFNISSPFNSGHSQG
ncbi:hypothetical protein Ciccas_013452, partial [Cichlidogyrus casuarinus]